MPTPNRAVVFLALFLLCLAPSVHRGAPSEAGEPRYDILLKGGHVLDPANHLNGVRDIAISEGKIAAVERAIPEEDAYWVVDVSGLYVTPGLIDLHAHCHVGRFAERPSVLPDSYLASGTTTIVDAGTWGADGFLELKRRIIDRSRVRVLAFLNIVRTGMTSSESDPGEQDVSRMDADLCAATITKHRDLLVGVKTAHYWTHQPWEEAHPPWAAVDRALEAGRLADVPVMVDFWPRPPERSYPELILKKLRPGDIHTHMFAQQFPIIDSRGKVFDYLVEAKRRGVLFDLGHGASSFWFRNAVPAIEQGFLPDTISTDLHFGNMNGPVISLIHTMSKILALGVPLEDVIRRVTVSPAKIIRRPELGTLSVGAEADLAVIELLRGKFGYTDCGWTKITGDAKLENRLTLRAGQIVYDPTGLSTVEWQNAPAQYFTSPKFQNSPRATAHPEYLRRLTNSAN